MDLVRILKMGGPVGGPGPPGLHFVEERLGGPRPPTGPSDFENVDKEEVGGPRCPMETGSKRFIVAPAIYPRLVEFLHFDIQSTKQKSHCVNIRGDHCNALF